MRNRPIHAALLERVPFKLWSQSKARTVLAAVAASAAAIVPAVMVASPAMAATVPSLTVSAAGAYEGGWVPFTVTYTGGTAQTINFSADVDPNGGQTAAATSTDFETTTDTPSYSFPVSSSAHPTTITVKVQTHVNSNVATDQTFELKADDTNSNETTAVGTIWDTPATNTVTLTGPTTVPESVGTVTVTANMSAVQTHDVMIPMHTTDGTAISTGGVNRDYTALASDAMITIPAGQLSGTVNLTINDDNVNEAPTQSFTVATGTGPGATGAAGIAPGTTSSDSMTIGIQDNDAVPTVSIGTPNAVTEGGTMAFPIMLSGPSERSVTVNFATTPGDATTSANAASPWVAGQNGNPGTGDYTSTNAPVSIPNYSTTYNALVATHTDSTVEGDETVKGTISAPSTGLTLGSPTSANGVIKDADTPPAVSLTTETQPGAVAPAQGQTTSTTYTEPGATDLATFINVKIPAASAIDTKINYAFQDDTAKNGVDYVGTSGSVTITAGQTSTKIPVTLKYNKNFQYPNERFGVTLSSPNGSIDPATSSPQYITIKNPSNTAPTWSVGDVTAPEGNTGSTMAHVPFTLSAPVNTDTVLSVTLTPVTATEGGNATTNPGADDYDNPTTMSVTIPAGQTTANFDVPVHGDAVYEGDETITVTGSSNGGLASAAGHGTSTLTIKDDDAKPVISFNETAATEGSTVRVVPSVTGVAQNPFAFSMDVVASGTGKTDATAGTDYIATGINAQNATTALPLVYSVQPGTTGSLVAQGYGSVYLSPDSINEPTETYNATAVETTTNSIVNKIGIANATGVYKISDNPGTPPPTASIGDVTVNDTAGTANVPVTLMMQGDTASSTQDYSVHYTTVANTAKAGTDFVAKSGTLTIPAGTMTGNIVIDILNAKTKKADTTFWVKLDSPMPKGAAITSGHDAATVTVHSTATASAPTIMAPATVKGMSAFQVTGTADAGAKVTLWVRPMASPTWLRGPMVTVGASGSFSFTRMLTTGAEFKVDADGMQSGSKTTWVQQVPSLTASSPSKGVLSVTAGTNPAWAGAPVVVQKVVKGAWVTGWSGKAAANGKLSATAKLASKTLIAVRTYVPGDEKNGILPGYSAAIWVSIK